MAKLCAGHVFGACVLLGSDMKPSLGLLFSGALALAAGAMMNWGCGGNTGGVPVGVGGALQNVRLQAAISTLTTSGGSTLLTSVVPLIAKAGSGSGAPPLSFTVTLKGAAYDKQDVIYEYAIPQGLQATAAVPKDATSWSSDGVDAATLGSGVYQAFARITKVGGKIIIEPDNVFVRTSSTQYVPMKFAGNPGLAPSSLSSTEIASIVWVSYGDADQGGARPHHSTFNPTDSAWEGRIVELPFTFAFVSQGAAQLVRQGTFDAIVTLLTSASRADVRPYYSILYSGAVRIDGSGIARLGSGDGANIGTDSDGGVSFAKAVDLTAPVDQISPEASKVTVDVKEVPLFNEGTSATPTYQVSEDHATGGPAAQNVELQIVNRLRQFRGSAKAFLPGAGGGQVEVASTSSDVAFGISSEAGAYASGALTLTPKSGALTLSAPNLPTPAAGQPAETSAITAKFDGVGLDVDKSVIFTHYEVLDINGTSGGMVPLSDTQETTLNVSSVTAVDSGVVVKFDPGTATLSHAALINERFKLRIHGEIHRIAGDTLSTYAELTVGNEAIALEDFIVRAATSNNAHSARWKSVSYAAQDSVQGGSYSDVFNNDSGGTSLASGTVQVRNNSNKFFGSIRIFSERNGGGLLLASGSSSPSKYSLSEGATVAVASNVEPQANSPIEATVAGLQGDGSVANPYLISRGASATLGISLRLKSSVELLPAPARLFDFTVSAPTLLTSGVSSAGVFTVKSSVPSSSLATNFTITVTYPEVVNGVLNTDRTYSVHFRIPGNLGGGTVEGG